MTTVHPGRMRFGSLTILCLLIAALALVAAGVGLFWSAGSGPVTVTTVQGEVVRLYGRGVYRSDTPFIAAGARGTDAVTLLVGIPLLLLALYLRYRRSLHGRLLLSGVLAWFLYVYASLALGAVAFNPLFLVYVALFSASLFAFGLALREAYTVFEETGVVGHLPRRGPAVFLLASGLITLVIWLGPLLEALSTGRPPVHLRIYTGRVTDALDLGIITPTAIVTGVLVLRGRILGFTAAVPLLILEAFLLPMIVAQTISQLDAGVAFSVPEIIGPIGGFVVLAALSLWVLASILQHVPYRDQQGETDLGT